MKKFIDIVSTEFTVPITWRNDSPILKVLVEIAKELDERFTTEFSDREDK